VSQINNISNSSNPARRRLIYLLLIFLAGAMIVAMHDAFRWPLKMPGRHGLELMTILVFVRAASGERYAALLAAVGGVVAISMFGHGTGVESLVLLLQGLVIDLGWRVLRSQRLWLLVLPVIAGMAHTLKPLTKLFFQQGFGIASDSLVNGLAYPMLTHFVFGLVGGIFGALAFHAMHKNNHPNQ
jgi:cell shape-determining protein MreD